MALQLMSATSLSPNRLAEPPPHVELIDGDRSVGWIRGDAIGFRGFGTAIDAAHAAWIAHRTLAQRIAREENGRPIPIDTEPLVLDARDASTRILASGRAIATLVTSDTTPACTPAYGFEIRVPAPTDALRMRSMAHLVYRTIRKSGVRWALWKRFASATAMRPTRLHGADRTHDTAVRRPVDTNPRCTGSRSADDAPGGAAGRPEASRSTAQRRSASWVRAGA